MSIIDEIKLYIKHGKFPIVQDSAGDLFVVNVCYKKITRITEYEKDKKDLQLGSDEEIYSDEEIENTTSWEIVGQYDIPTIPFAVGQKVKVREDLGEVFDISSWCREAKDKIGTIQEIASIENYCTGLHYYFKNSTATFRHDWLLPVLEEECCCKKLTSFGHMTVDSEGCCVKCGTKVCASTKRTVDDVLAGLSDEDKEIIKRSMK